ncbi:MAG: DUF417 family protein [Mucilaginibacter sp.]|uniref:DUF417 family protein n=1 Tax=Mucilaginibacter sp. TaxID=1882438 RepID=UPI003265F209
MKENSKIEKLGYNLSVIGAASLLILFGIQKFTFSGTAGIKSMTEGHFVFSTLYTFLTARTVSILLGIPQIALGLLMIASLRMAGLGKAAGIGGIVIFASSLLFLISYPDAWMLGAGFSQTVLFIVRDLPNLALSLRIWGDSRHRYVSPQPQITRKKINSPRRISPVSCLPIKDASKKVICIPINIYSN